MAKSGERRGPSASVSMREGALLAQLRAGILALLGRRWVAEDEELYEGEDQKSYRELAE